MGNFIAFLLIAQKAHELLGRGPKYPPYPFDAVSDCLIDLMGRDREGMDVFRRGNNNCTGSLDIRYPEFEIVAERFGELLGIYRHVQVKICQKRCKNLYSQRFKLCPGLLFRLLLFPGRPKIKVRRIFCVRSFPSVRLIWPPAANVPWWQQKNLTFSPRSRIIFNLIAGYAPSD